MKHYPYSERDYPFGQLMLTLRTTIGLTQAGLGERLGVSRRAVAEWEAGLSYPKAERLKLLITLGVQQQGFPAGREEQEIRTLWKVAHQKVLLDEAWLADLLAPPASVQPSPPAAPPAAPAGAEPTAFPRVDLVEALDTSHFTGREVEVAELSQWILQERCRVVTLLGIGGIGKSTLASYLGSRLAHQFEAALWRSVRDAPACSELVADCSPSSPRRPPRSSPHRWSSASPSSWPACRRAAACWCSTTWRRSCRAVTARGATCPATRATAGSSGAWPSRLTRAACC